MLRRFSPHFYATILCFGLLAIELVNAEEIVLDDYQTVFQFNNVSISGAGNLTLPNLAIMSSEGHIRWDDSGAGIYGGTRTMTITNYQADTGFEGGAFTSNVSGDAIQYGANDGVRVEIVASYSNLGGLDLSNTNYMTFDMAFDEQARTSARALVLFRSGAITNQAVVSFENFAPNSGEGQASIDLNSMGDFGGWDAATWTSMKTNISSIEYVFYDTEFASDFSFKTQGFNSEATGTILTQTTPEPTSLIMFGIVLTTGFATSRRRRNS